MQEFEEIGKLVRNIAKDGACICVGTVLAPKAGDLLSVIVVASTIE